MNRKINVLCGWDSKDKSRDAMLISPSYRICDNHCVEITLSSEQTTQLIKDLLNNQIYCGGLEK